MIQGANLLGRSLLGGRISRGAVAAAITISSPTGGATVGASFTLSGATTTAAAVEYQVDGGSWATLATPSGGEYSGTVAGLSAGVRNLAVRQSDVPANMASVSITVVVDSVSVTSPASFQLIRRGASTTASIPVTFTFTGSFPSGWQARFNRTGSESWQTFAEGTSPRTITLTGEPKGYGAIEVRSATTPALVSTVTPVAVGRAIAIMGQSNASGRGTNQTAPSAGAYLYDNTGHFRALEDPYDGNFGGTPTYSVLNDGGAAGSYAPPLAALYIADGEPTLMIPVNIGGTNIAYFAPGTEIYNACKARMLAAGGVDIVIWHQGEADIDGGQTTSYYQPRLEAIADQLQTDFPGSTFAVNTLYYDNGGASTVSRDAIRLAQFNTIASRSFVYLGGDVYPYTGTHISNLAAFAAVMYPNLLAIYTPRMCTLTLTTNGSTPAANETGISWAWYDAAPPDFAALPRITGTGATTDASGVFSVTLTGTVLSIGQTGTLLAVKSNGTVGSAANKAFCAPVVVS